jgi:hypothetical protein
MSGKTAICGELVKNSKPQMIKEWIGLPPGDRCKRCRNEYREAVRRVHLRKWLGEPQ